MHGSGHGPIAFLIVANLILLIGGQFMEPLGLPVAIEPGIDPIHIGFIQVVNTETGTVTPPVELGLVRHFRRRRHPGSSCHSVDTAISPSSVRVSGPGHL